MTTYFQDHESIHYRFGGDISQILGTVAGRYTGQHPEAPFTFRIYNDHGIRRSSDYRYQFDLDVRFPSAEIGQVVNAWAKLWWDIDSEVLFSASACGPMSLYLNDVLAFQSNIIDEKFSDQSREFTLGLRKGWNTFWLVFTKTASGFGGAFGTGFAKNDPLHFLAPTLEREGQEGWVYTCPMECSLENCPLPGSPESSMDVSWLPQRIWNEKQKLDGQLKRLYGLPGKRCTGAGWVKVRLLKRGNAKYRLECAARSPVRIYLNASELAAADQPGVIEKTFHANGGLHDIVVLCEEGPMDWGFELKLFQEDGAHIEFISPCNIKGTDDPWIYLGPLSNFADADLADYRSLNRVYQSETGYCYWQVDGPGLKVRPYLENALFGKWNYPLGVTLYGLLRTGNEMGRMGLVDYIRKHVEMCTSFYEYALWDKQNYGAAGINNQLSDIDSLDDCGSFASLMLELGALFEVNNLRKVADDVADYIVNNQARLSDGALFRYRHSIALMNDTMWIDDLYMSVPFLIRYSSLTNEPGCMDEAVRQILLYKDYLYMKDKKLMAHVYDTARNRSNGIAWGRGNGWVLFSLSELLTVLPERHEKRADLLDFFRDLSEGYLSLQDEEGIWHQVLTDHESYQETSCTAMFVYAFARGVRFGWLDHDVFTNAAWNGWRGMARKLIDRSGNIYGVCKGSGYSFHADYYRELQWNLNDTHGTGIVLLAGVEMSKLLNWLAE